MCGIAGFCSSTTKNNKELLQKMLAQIQHRGPDEQGEFQDKKISLGMRRLSIIDLSTGSQPIFNENKTLAIVFNGEIYNFKQLYRQLLKKGHKFKTKSDTEVIIHLYEDLGPSCLKKLNGMFAFCIYDKKKQQLFFAIDRAGKKPLYFHHHKQNFAFASELKSFYPLPFFDKKTDQTAINKFFIYGYIPTPLTPYFHTQKLPSGHYATFNLRTHKLKIAQYWDFDYSKKLKLSKDQWVEKIDNLIGRAIKRRLVSDVPLGCFLSGGIDSSIVTAHMSKLIKKGQLKTFSIGFNTKRVDESKFAQQVSKLYNTQHHLKIFPLKKALSVAKEIFSKLDEPLADPSILPTFLLSKFAKQYVTVALSGDGGDEMFGGYPKYYIHRYLKIVDLLPKKIKIDLANKLAKLIKTNPKNKYLNYKAIRLLQSLKYPAHQRNQIWAGSFTPEQLNKLIPNSNNNEEDLLSESLKLSQKIKTLNQTDLMFYLDSKLMLKDAYLTKVDRASMAASLEVRSPFLDTSILNLTGRIPTRLKVKNTQTKYILKQVALKYLPKDLVFRHKQGFGLPLAEWMKDKKITDFILTCSKIKINSQFNKDYIKELVKDHKQGTNDHSTQLWTLYSYFNWQKYHL